MEAPDRSQFPSSRISRTLSERLKPLAERADDSETVWVGRAKRVVGARARTRVIVFVKIILTDIVVDVVDVDVDIDDDRCRRDIISFAICRYSLLNRRP
jgi:hypothetical protein